LWPSGSKTTLNKNDILELISTPPISAGASWGIEMGGAQLFRQNRRKTLSLGEGAMLAGLLKGPNY